MKEEQLLTTGSTAHRLKRSVQAVYYYERQGKLNPLRTDTGMRLFKLEEVNRLAAELEEKRTA